MPKNCRTCRYWHPYELWDRHPEEECSAICGYRSAVDWQVECGGSVPPWVNASYWCRHHRTAWIPLAQMAVVERWDKLVDFVKYDTPLRHYREWRRQRRMKLEARHEGR